MRQKGNIADLSFTGFHSYVDSVKSLNGLLSSTSVDSWLKCLLPIAKDTKLKKTIPNPDGSPYLTRYVLAHNYREESLSGVAGMPEVSEEDYPERTDGFSVYLHNIHTHDYGNDFHSHPWNATSLIINGWYREVELKLQHSEREGYSVWQILADIYVKGNLVPLSNSLYHRIATVGKDTWTLVVVGKRTSDWGFYSIKDPRVDYTHWKDYKVR